MRPDSPRDFGAIQIIYLLTYLLTLLSIRQDRLNMAYWQPVNKLNRQLGHFPWKRAWSSS